MGSLDGHIPLLAMTALQIHYAVVGIFIRALLSDGLSATVFVVYRQAISTLALLPIFFSHKRRQSLKSSSFGLRIFSLTFVAAFIGIAANQNAYVRGLYYASPTAATAINNLIPALTFVIATIVGYEKFEIKSKRSVAKVIGTVCCVSGALIIVLFKGHKVLNMEFLPSSKHVTITNNGVGEDWLLGCLFLLAGCLFYSCWMIIQVPISSCCPDNLLSTFWMCFYATIQSTIFALLFQQDLQAWFPNSPLQFSFVLLYAGIGTAVSTFVQSWGISKRGPLYCAMFNPLATVITALISATFLKEQLYIGSLIGAVGVIAGLYLVLWGKHQEIDEIKKEAPQSNLMGGDTSSNIDLEEPLLLEKSTQIVVESKIEQAWH